MYSGNLLFYPRVAQKTGSPVASQSLTVSTSAVAATGYTDDAQGGGSVGLVMFDIQGGPVRVRFDGTDPTSTVGHKLYSGTNYCWNVQLYNAAKWIRDTTATADATVFATPLNV